MSLGSFVIKKIIPLIVLLLGARKGTWEEEKYNTAILSLIMIPLKKLKGARRSLMDSNADKQRAIRTNYGIISDNAYGATGIRTIAPYQAMVNQILNANPSDFSTMDPIQGAVITVDYRGKNVFGGG